MQRHKTTDDPNEDTALFASTPEVTASSRSISDIITAQRKTRDQQIQDLQAIIDIQTVEVEDFPDLVQDNRTDCCPCF